MLYNIYYVMLCYITCHVMLYNMCHVMLYNICHHKVQNKRSKRLINRGEYSFLFPILFSMNSTWNLINPLILLSKVSWNNELTFGIPSCVCGSNNVKWNIFVFNVSLSMYKSKLYNTAVVDNFLKYCDIVFLDVIIVNGMMYQVNQHCQFLSWTETMNRCYRCILGLHADAIYSDVISFCTERALFENTVDHFRGESCLWMLNSHSRFKVTIARMFWKCSKEYRKWLLMTRRK